MSPNIIHQYSNMRLVDSFDESESVTKVAMMVWDTGSLSWIRYTPSAGGGGGDATAANQTTEIARLEAIRDRLPSLIGQDSMANSMSVAIATNQSAVSMDLRRSQTVLFAAISAASSGNNTIVSADATKKIKVLHYTFVADSAVAVKWRSGSSTDLTGAMSLAANGGVASQMGTPGGGWLIETAANEALVLNLSGAVGVRGHISYFLEA